MIDKTNLKSILSRIAFAKDRSDHNSRVEIVAVTKNQAASVITSSYNLGLRHIGENRVQEG